MNTGIPGIEASERGPLSSLPSIRFSGATKSPEGPRQSSEMLGLDGDVRRAEPVAEIGSTAGAATVTASIPFEISVDV
jgi:hypothetical protein